MAARSAARTNDRKMRHACKTGPALVDLQGTPAVPGERRRRQGPGKGDRYPGGSGSVLSSVGPRPHNAASLSLLTCASCEKERFGGLAARQFSCLFRSSVADVRIHRIYADPSPKATADRSFFAIRLLTALAGPRQGSAEPGLRTGLQRFSHAAGSPRHHGRRHSPVRHRNPRPDRPFPAPEASGSDRRPVQPIPENADARAIHSRASFRI